MLLGAAVVSVRGLEFWEYVRGVTVVVSVGFGGGSGTMGGSGD